MIYTADNKTMSILNCSDEWDKRAQSLSDRIQAFSQNVTYFSHAYLNKPCKIDKNDYLLIKELFERDLIIYPYHFTHICLENAYPKDPFDSKKLAEAANWCRLFVNMAIAYNLDFCVDELIPLVRASTFIHDPNIKQIYKDVFSIFIKKNIKSNDSLSTGSNIPSDISSILSEMDYFKIF